MSSELNPISTIVITPSSHDKVELTKKTCFFCNDPSGSTTLHRACTHDIDDRVLKCATQLQGTNYLLIKFASEDMVAQSKVPRVSCKSVQ